jgi:hypothetical protein
VLGERVRTEGAPDSGLAVVYPPKLKEQPFWLTWDYKTFKDFKHWTWLQATKALDLPIGEKTETWYNYFSIQSNQIKAKELLDPFRKEKQEEFGILLQDKYNLVIPAASSSTKQIRKQLATLNHYMRNVAKGDVSKLCEHTRELMFELNASDETTNDLLENLIEALKEAPDSNFQRWLSNEVDLWSMRKLDWKQDGSV